MIKQQVDAFEGPSDDDDDDDNHINIIEVHILKDK